MTAEIVIGKLPYGVGRITRRWLLFIGVAIAALLFGIYAYSLQLTKGEIVTGLRDIGPMGGAAWGLYIVLAVYFAGIAFGGITLAALIRLLKLDHMRPLARIAGLLTIVAITLGALSIVADLGQPFRGSVNLFMYARPQSPFFGTFTLIISGYLFASLTYMYLDSRRDAAICAQVPGRLQWFHRIWAAGYGDTPAEQKRHERVSFWLALVILPLMVIAASTLGFAFSLQAGRPGWYSALQAPTFVVLAGVSGLGLLIVLGAIVRRTLRERESLSIAVFSWLGKSLMVLLLIYVYFVMVDLLTSTLAGTANDAAVTGALLWGEYSGLYWLSIAAIVIPLILLLWQYFTNRWSVALLVVTGILVNLAAILKRYLIVVPSQIYGSLLPYEIGFYAPTWVEYGTAIGLVGLGALLFGLFLKAFPIMVIHERSEGGV